MRRAAVLIGVDQTGNLPKLNDAAKGARRMEQWARSQGMNPIVVFTDEAGPVKIGDILGAITNIVDAGTTEQLLVYFAGHGVNIQRQEYWLLSGAPRNPMEAVNVRGSVTSAQFSGIPYVVIISDACRTSAEGIQAQNVTGGEIFPNDSSDDREKPVDLFFACTLGMPAHEIKDPNVAAAEFSALYTSTLLAALKGERCEMYEWSNDGKGFLRPRQLRDYLSSEVLKRIKGLKLQSKVIQIPDAHIASDPVPEVWISEVSAASAVKVRGGGTGLPESLHHLMRSLHKTAATTSRELVKSALDPDPNKVSENLRLASDTDLVNVKELTESTLHIKEAFGPMHFESGCGFKIRGAQFVEAYSRNASTHVFEVPGTAVRVNAVTGPGASVLLVLDRGTGVLLPAIPGFIAGLTVQQGELVDVAYEPSDNSSRWSEYLPKETSIRQLRAIASASMTNGVFHLEGIDTKEIAARMRYGRGVDPTLAVYAAYAYNDLQLRETIREISGYLKDDLCATLFDVALLARELDGKKVGEQPVLSCIPLLAQGWALLNSHRITLPTTLSKLQAMLVPSVWTMFNQEGIRLIRSAIDQGGVK